MKFLFVGVLCLDEMSTNNLPGVKEQAAHNADVTPVCEAVVQKVWEPRHLTILGTSTTCYIGLFLLSCAGLMTSQKLL